MFSDEHLYGRGSMLGCLSAGAAVRMTVVGVNTEMKQYKPQNVSINESHTDDAIAMKYDFMQSV